jgi:hypothetical protein
MIGIKWISALITAPHGEFPAQLLDHAGLCVVAGCAEGHQRIERRVRVPACLDGNQVVNNGGRLDTADLDAEFTQGFFLQLEPP